MSVQPTGSRRRENSSPSLSDRNHTKSGWLMVRTNIISTLPASQHVISLVNILTIWLHQQEMLTHTSLNHEDH